MTDLEGFRKVLSALSKEDLVNISDNFGLPTSGKKEKLVENILKNSTFLERIIKETVRESSKDDLIEMCEHLGIESNASAPELKQQILQKLDETVGNKDLQNQIKFLNVALSFADLDTDDLADVLDDNGLPISGKKSDLIELIAKNDSVMEGVFSICKENSGIEEIKDCCEELGIKSDGVRKDLETRIEDYLFKKEKNVSNNIESEINDRKKRNISKNKKNIIVKKIGDYNLIYLLATKYPSKAFKLFVDEQKNAYPHKSIIILVSSDDTKVSIIVGITNDITEKFDATSFVKIASTIVGGNGGGGRKDLAQAGGNEPTNVKKIFDEIKNEILKLS